MKQVDILLIDDETRRMRATIEMLRNDGFQIEQIASPSKALHILSREPGICRVIVLDIMMPADGEFDVPESQFGLRTGFLLLDKLKKLDGFQTPIIVLTAAAQYKDDLFHEVWKFHVKPVPYETLKNAINQAIASNGGMPHE